MNRSAATESIGVGNEGGGLNQRAGLVNIYACALVVSGRHVADDRTGFKEEEARAATAAGFDGHPIEDGVCANGLGRAVELDNIITVVRGVAGQADVAA